MQEAHDPCKGGRCRARGLDAEDAFVCQVPKYVYDTWVAKLETSNSSVKMEDLGKLRIITKPGQKEPEVAMPS